MDKQQKKKEVKKMVSKEQKFCCLSNFLHLKKTVCRKRSCVIVSTFFVAFQSTFS